MAANIAGIHAGDAQVERELEVERERHKKQHRRNRGWQGRMPTPMRAPPEEDFANGRPAYVRMRRSSTSSNASWRSQTSNLGQLREDKLQETPQRNSGTPQHESFNNPSFCPCCGQGWPGRNGGDRSESGMDFSNYDQDADLASVDDPEDETGEPEVKLLKKLLEKMNEEELNQELTKLREGRLKEVFDSVNGVQKVIETYGHYTALQTACKGRASDTKIVVGLLCKRASPSGNCDNAEKSGGYAVSPLDIAIEGGAYYFLRPLLHAKADLMRRYPSPQDSKCGGYHSTLSHIFKTSNAVCISAVAKHLTKKENEGVLNRLPQHLLCKFLETPGKAPKYILEAIFQQTPIFEPSSDELRGDCIDTAKVRPLFVKCGLGPYGNTEKMSKAEFDKFIKAIAPQQDEASAMGTSFFIEDIPMHPIDVFKCTIPDIHKDTKFLMAMAATDATVYELDATKAYVKVMWTQIKYWIYFDILSQVIIVLLLIPLSFCLGSHRPDWWFTDGWVATPKFWAGVIIPFWSHNLLIEVCECVGHVALGETRKYFFDWVNWAEFMTLLGGVCGLVVVIMFGGESSIFEVQNSESILRICLVPLLIRGWNNMLYTLRLLDNFGQNTLPIFASMKRLVWFVLCVASYLCMFVHIYYALDIHSLRRSFIVMYRMALLGDFDLYELENQDPTLEGTIPAEGDPMVLEEEDPPDAGMRNIINVVFVCVTLMMTILFMNIFIAVLCKEYEVCRLQVDEQFLRSRLSCVFDKQATWQGARSLRTCNYRATHQNHHANRTKRSQSAEKTEGDGMGVRKSMSTTALHGNGALFTCPRCQDADQCATCKKDEKEFRTTKAKYIWYARANLADNDDDEDH